MTDIEPGEITTKMGMHMTGEGFTSRTDHILIGGEETELMMAYTTNGRPHFEYTSRELVYRAGKDDEETLDLMGGELTKEELHAWIRERGP